MISHRSPRSRLAMRLAELRRQAGLSREQVAQRASVSVHLVQSLEQGRTVNPTVETVLGLAHALGVPASELIDSVAADLAAKRSRQAAIQEDKVFTPSSQDRRASEAASPAW
jgi:transcriptional regulator with XRE-family HTH domain